MPSQCPTRGVSTHLKFEVSALLSSHGRSVQLRCAHGQTERADLWGGGAPDRLQIHEGGAAVPGAPHGEEEGGVRLVPTTQDLLRHDPET